MSAITLDISFIDRPEWLFADRYITFDENKTDVWRITVSDHLHLLNTFTTVLHADEIARAKRYLRKEDHDRFIISRASLRHILSKYIDEQPTSITFEYEPNRKPYVPGAAIHYNLSDSGNQILVAIGRFPVGIDVEYIKPHFHYDTILPLNFNPLEIDFINETDSSPRFFMLWTRKEAILKATGIGLTDHLKQIPSLNGLHTMDGEFISTKNNWKLQSFFVNEDYIATVATGRNSISYNFYEFNHG